jgi:hypothetical protein
LAKIIEDVAAIDDINLYMLISDLKPKNSTEILMEDIIVKLIQIENYISKLYKDNFHKDYMGYIMSNIVSLFEPAYKNEWENLKLKAMSDFLRDLFKYYIFSSVYIESLESEKRFADIIHDLIIKCQNEKDYPQISYGVKEEKRITKNDYIIFEIFYNLLYSNLFKELYYA